MNAAGYRFFSIAQDMGLQVEHTLHTLRVRTQGTTVQLIRLRTRWRCVVQCKRPVLRIFRARVVCSGPY